MFSNKRAPKGKTTVYNLEGDQVVTVNDYTGKATLVNSPPYSLCWFTIRTKAEKRKKLRELKYHQKTKRNVTVGLYRITDERLTYSYGSLYSHLDPRVHTMEHWYTFGFSVDDTGINAECDLLEEEKTELCTECKVYITIKFPTECPCAKNKTVRKIQKCWRKYKAYKKLKEWATDPRWIEYIYRPGSIGAKWQELRWTNKTS